MTSSFIIYILQSCFCMLAFYTFYFFVLKNENYHQLNRLYLLFSLIFSLGIPVLDFSINESAPILVETIINIDDQIEGEVSNIFTPSKVEQTNSVSINTLLLVIYLIGVFFFAIRLFINLIKIRRLISNGKQTKIDEFTIIETDKAHPVFSFFNIILWSSLRNYSTADEEKILAHEKIHVQQKHSVDLMLCEILQIFMWFNPIVSLYKQSLKNIHEYISDQLTYKNYHLSYVELLIKEAKTQQQNSLPAVNTFFNNQIKKRLTMIKNSEYQSNRIKLLGAFPILTLLVLTFCFDCNLMAQSEKRNEYHVKLEQEDLFTAQGEKRTEEQIIEGVIENAKTRYGQTVKKEHVILHYPEDLKEKTVGKILGHPEPSHHPIFKKDYWTRMVKEGKIEVTATDGNRQLEIISFDATISKPLKGVKGAFKTFSTSYEGNTLNKYGLDYIAKIEQELLGKSSIEIRNIIVIDEGTKYLIPTKTKLSLDF